MNFFVLMGMVVVCPFVGGIVMAVANGQNEFTVEKAKLLAS
jgi:hypothetical protein